MENFDGGDGSPAPDGSAAAPDLRHPPGVPAQPPRLGGAIKAPAVSPAIVSPVASAPTAVEEVFDSSWDSQPAAPMEASLEDKVFLEELLPSDPAADRRVVTTLLRALLAENRGP